MAAQAYILILDLCPGCLHRLEVEKDENCFSMPASLQRMSDLGIECSNPSCEVHIEGVVEQLQKLHNRLVQKKPQMQTIENEVQQSAIQATLGHTSGPVDGSTSMSNANRAAFGDVQDMMDVDIVDDETLVIMNVSTSKATIMDPTLLNDMHNKAMYGGYIKYNNGTIAEDVFRNNQNLGFKAEYPAVLEGNAVRSYNDSLKDALQMQEKGRATYVHMAQNIAVAGPIQIGTARGVQAEGNQGNDATVQGALFHHTHAQTGIAQGVQAQDGQVHDANAQGLSINSAHAHNGNLATTAQDQLQAGQMIVPYPSTYAEFNDTMDQANRIQMARIQSTRGWPVKLRAAIADEKVTQKLQTAIAGLNENSTLRINVAALLEGRQIPPCAAHEPRTAGARHSFDEAEVKVIVILRNVGFSFSQIAKVMPLHTPRSIESKYHSHIKGGRGKKANKAKDQNGSGTPVAVTAAAAPTATDPTTTAAAAPAMVDPAMVDPSVFPNPFEQESI